MIIMVNFEILDVTKINNKELMLNTKLYLMFFGREVYGAYLVMFLEKREDGVYLTHIQGDGSLSMVGKAQNKKLSEQTIREINKIYYDKYGDDWV